MTQIDLNVRAARASLGLSRSALARALGVTQRAVQSWELGQRTIGPASAKALNDLIERERELSAITFAARGVVK